MLKSSLSKKEKLSKYVPTLSVDAIVFFADRAVRTWRSFKQLKQFRVDPPRIRVLTLPACCCAVAPATDMNPKAAAVDGTDRRTDRQTLGRCMDPAQHTMGACSVNSSDQQYSIHPSVYPSTYQVYFRQTLLLILRLPSKMQTAP